MAVKGSLSPVVGRFTYQVSAGGPVSLTQTRYRKILDYAFEINGLSKMLPKPNLRAMREAMLKTAAEGLINALKVEKVEAVSHE